MIAHPCRQVGVEIELLAPVGSSRRALAEHIAHRLHGSVRAFFHLDSEPSKVQGKPLFYHLTQGIEILDANGKPVAKCVDDITLQNDLDKSKAPAPGWYRIVSDEVRLLRLIARHSQADLPLAETLYAIGKLFGTQPKASKGGVYRLSDASGASIALAAPLPGERERACELVTAPLAADDRTTLPLLLACARELDFRLPQEGATHIHFDAAPFCSAPALQTLVNTLHPQRETLRQQLRTNPNCRRLGQWSEGLLAAINAEDFATLDWAQARARLATLPKQQLTKYCDFNIRNLILPIPGKHTFEVRILSSTLDAAEIHSAIDLFQTIFAEQYAG
jgi:hypothetical protein